MILQVITSKMNITALKEKIQTGNYGQANYQLVVICHLLQTPELRDNKKNIAKVLQQKNKGLKRNVSHFMNCPVWKVLTIKGIIIKISDGYKLNLTQKSTNTQRKEILKLCKELLK